MGRPDRPLDSPLRLFSYQGRPVAYADDGPPTGPVLVCVHGLPGSVRDFRWLAASMPDVRVVRLELPGFGSSDPNPATVNISARARVVLALMDQLKIESAFIAGHSFGGATAVAFAVEHAARTLGLCALAPIGLRIHKGLRSFPVPEAVARVMDLPLVGPRFSHHVQEQFRRAGFRATLPETRLSVEYIRKWDFAAHAERVSKVSVPTALSYAEDDHIIEGEIMQELGVALPAGPRLVFEKGGHNIQASQSLELGRWLQEWMHSV